MYQKFLHHNTTPSLMLLSLSDLLLHRYPSGLTDGCCTTSQRDLCRDTHGRSTTSSRDGQGSPLRRFPHHHLPVLPGHPQTDRPPRINPKGAVFLEDQQPATHQCREGGNTKGDARKPCKVEKGQSKSTRKVFAKRREGNKLQQQDYNADCYVAVTK